MSVALKFKAVAAGLISAVLLLMIMPFTNVSASSKVKTYRIGANAMHGVNETELGFSGLTCDYLNAVSKYTGDSFTYVSGTTDELFEMLKNGGINALACVTSDELEYYEKLLGGTKEAPLFKKTGAAVISRFSAVYVYDEGRYGDMTLGDVSAIRRMKIGYQEEDKHRYFDDKEFLYSEIAGASFVPYNDEEKMRSDLVSGEIDAVVKDCMRSWNNETIVYQFPSRSGYFITRANDADISVKLENGLMSLFSEYPTFYGDAYERYVANFGSRKYAFSAEENDYKKSHKEITVGFNRESDVMHCYDQSSGKLSGVTGSVMEKYSEMTGLDVKIKPYSSLDDCYLALDNNEVDLIYGGIHTTDTSMLTMVSSIPPYYVSAPAVKYPHVLAGKDGAELSDTMTIAVSRDDVEAASSLGRLFPNADIIYTDTVTQACDMALSGDCDAACVGGYDMLYLKGGDYPKLEIIQSLPVYSTECFALRSENTALSGITDKALLRINNSAMTVDIYDLAETAEHSALSNSKQWIFFFVYAGIVVLTVAAVILIAGAVKRRAEIDPLTGGVTKKTFIEKTLKTIKKSGTSKWTLVVFDIDKFKFINDHLGYEEGNRILERLFKTIGDHMDSSEMYARVSEDNFACCIHDASDNDIENRMEGLFEEFGRRNSLFVSYPVQFSGGACRLEQCTDKYGAVELNVAFDRCNIAKKAIKGMHKSTIAFYDDRIREKTLHEKDIENAMPAALEHKEFLCYIQPKYGARSRKIEGGEALIRWNSSDFGFVFPDQFIPIAERNGFVVELDFFILEEVCKAMRRWLDMGLEPVVISVNQSRMHMSHDDYIWRLREVVDKYAIPYEYIELEITETVFTENAELLLQVMQKLHDIGFQLSIDDFGSGYSSLNMLKDIPADVVKIDREFFNGTVNSDKGRAVITTVVDLAKKLRMHVISEGVETLDQVEFLAEINCDLIQGYYFAKPMPLKEFEEKWFKSLKEEADNAAENSEDDMQTK